MWIVEIEEGVTRGSGTVRNLYGPFDTIQEARRYAEYQPEGIRIGIRMVKPLSPPTHPVPNPNQTTIQDHIGSISDAHL